MLSRLVRRPRTHGSHSLLCKLHRARAGARFHAASVACSAPPSSHPPSEPYDGGNISDTPEDEQELLSPTTLPREASRTSHLPVSFGDIAKANFRVKNAVVTSECRWSEKLSEMYGVDLYFKMEHEQRTVGRCLSSLCFALLCFALLC